MKNQLKYLLVIVSGFIVINFTGCILDAFNTITQELPYKFNIGISGTGTNIDRTGLLNLDDNSFYFDKRNKIRQLSLVKIAYKTISVTPSDLQGNISLILRKTDNTIIFSKDIPEEQPSAYLTYPYELNLSEAELESVNNYFNQTSDRQLLVSISIDNLNSGTTINLDTEIFVVFEIEYDL